MTTRVAPTRVLRAQIGGRAYPLHLGPGVLDRIGDLWAEAADGPGVLLVADGALDALAARVAGSLEAAGLRPVVAAVAPGEGSKTLAEVERLSRLAARAGLRRLDAVLALGGGVVGDLGGFVAATYQRGIRLCHAPTTLLAMVDSAVGGKTGVDLPEGKNYVGAVWQPHLVAMDTRTLETLPARELSCGWAEVVKYGLLEGEALFARVEAWPDLPGPEADLVDLVRDCVESKLRVVAADEHDRAGRAVLNLGHTVGHGIEAAGGYARFRHGEAIALGLLAALRVSEAQAGLDPSWRRRTRALLARHELPVRLPDDVSTEAILDAMGRDKKADGRSLNMVVLARPGEPRTHADPPPALVLRAIEELPRMSFGDLPEAPEPGALALAAAAMPLDPDVRLHRVALLHGPNLDMLGRRPSKHYGRVTLRELEERVEAWGAERGMRVSCFQTNHEGAFLEHVHGLVGAVDGALVNPGAWTHYQWSIRDALELLDAPFVEVHLSDIEVREPHRRVSVLRDLAAGAIWGRGPEGYRDALDILKERLA